MAVGSLSVVDRDDFEDVVSVILNGTEKLKILKVNGLGRLKKVKLCKNFKCKNLFTLRNSDCELIFAGFVSNVDKMLENWFYS